VLSDDQNATWCSAPNVQSVSCRRRSGGCGAGVQVAGVQQVVGAPLIVDK
jgi:hypothetical protein